MPRKYVRGSPTDRLLAYVSVSIGGCWEWTGKLDRYGYGHFVFNDKHWLAHRASYSLLKGPIPDGMTLDHLCRNTRCVNPDHLDPCTKSENSRRVPRKTHCPSGHEYTPENTYVFAGAPGHRSFRSCRACNLAAVTRYQALHGRSA